MNTDQDGVLKFVNKIHRHEMERHEQIIGSVFNWTLTTLLALGAGFIGFASSSGWHNLESYHNRVILKVLIGVLGFALSASAIREIEKRRSAYDKNAQVVVRVSILLNLLDTSRFGNPPLYPPEWKEWGGKRPAAKFLPAFHNFVLLLVSIALAIVPWLI